MKWFAPLISLSFVSAAQAETVPETLPITATQAAAISPENSVRSVDPHGPTCRDAIHAVREERALPVLRDNATPADAAQALLIFAVDREIDGCDVLVMANDPRDIRPLPRVDEQDWRLRPAQARLSQ